MQKVKKMGGLAFLPFVLLVLSYVVLAIVNGIAGTSFKLPIIAVLLVCIVVAFLMDKSKMDHKVDVFCQGASESGVMMTVMIFLLSGAFTSVASSIGAVDSTVNLALRFMPHSMIYAGLFLISAFLGISIGTSVGTVTAIAPIAASICGRTGLIVEIAFSAVIAGAVFGDNLSIVSDTTIAATKGVGADMKDKFRMNFLIVLPAAILTAVIYAVIGMNSNASGAFEVGGFELIKIVPYIYVLVAALLGMNVFTVLLSAIGLTAAIGFFTGSLTFIGLFEAIGTGMTKMASVVIMAILVKGLMGLIREYGGVDWLIQKLTGNIKSQKGAQYSIGILTAIFCMAMGSTTMAIITAVPLAKDIGEKYGIEPRRTASLLDIFSTTAMGFIFWGGFNIFTVNLTGVGDVVSITKYAIYFALVFISVIITIQFNLLSGKKKKEQVK